MRLLIATDMLLDLIAERPESIEAWNKLNALELTGSAELWAAASSYDALRAQLAEVIDDADVRSALRSTMSFITICSVDGSDVRFALDHADLPYEAAIAEACARKIQADYVVTNQGPPCRLTRHQAGDPDRALRRHRGRARHCVRPRRFLRRRS